MNSFSIIHNFYWHFLTSYIQPSSPYLTSSSSKIAEHLDESDVNIGRLGANYSNAATLVAK